MSLPWSLEGEIEIEKVGSPALVAQRLVEALRSEKAAHVELDGQNINFMAGAFRFVSSWNILVPFRTGSITVAGNEARIVLRYKGSFREMLIVCSLMASVVLFFSVISAVQHEGSVLEALFLGVVAWLWLYGGNAAIAAFCWPRWLARTARGEH